MILIKEKGSVTLDEVKMNLKPKELLDIARNIGRQGLDQQKIDFSIAEASKVEPVFNSTELSWNPAEAFKLDAEHSVRLKGYMFMSAAEKYELLLSVYPDITQRVSLTHIASLLGITLETLSRIRARS